MKISRKCVPFTPFDGDLSSANIAIVSAAGVHKKEQEAFNIADDLGDLSYRVIEGDVPSGDLMVTHHHYDHSGADEDINIVFPLDVLRELAEEGLSAGSQKSTSVIWALRCVSRICTMRRHRKSPVRSTVGRGPMPWS